MKRTMISALTILAVVLSLLSGCGNLTQTLGPTTPSTGNGSVGTTSTAEPPVQEDYAYEPIVKQNYTWGTSGTSGTNYIVAAGIADVVNDLSESGNFVVQSTAGATENLSLMLSGEMDFGYMSATSIYNGYYKIDYMADRVPAPYLYNVVLTTHGSVGHMIARADSGIKTYEDLAGKRVCTGTTSAEGHTVCEALIASYGYDIENDLKTYWMTQDEAMTRLQDGDLDAVYLTAGAPIAAFTNVIVADPGGYAIVTPDQEHLEAVLEDFPSLTITTIPAGTYSGIDFDVLGLRTAISVCTPVDTPAAVTYELAKYAYENWADIQNTHAALLQTKPENLAESPIPLHPGAAAFFREAGVIE
jgi:TRAP transporter TAXI family solute receptor